MSSPDPIIPATAAAAAAACSVMNGPAASTKDDDHIPVEDDAALVDSFFLPGGLFADENNNNNQSEKNISSSRSSSNHDMSDFQQQQQNQHQHEHPSLLHTIDSIPPATKCTVSSVASSLPKNPWETNNAATTAQTTNSITAASKEEGEKQLFMTTTSARMESSSGIIQQPLRLPLSSTNNDGRERDVRNDNGNGNKYNININNNNNNNRNESSNNNQVDLYDQYRQHQEENNTMGTTSIENSLFHHTQAVVFPRDNGNENSRSNGKSESNFTSRINDKKKILRPPPGFQNGPTIISTADTTTTTHVANLSQQQQVDNDQSQIIIKSMEFLPTNNSTTTGNEKSFQALTDDHRGIVIGEKGWDNIDDSCDAPLVTTTNLHDPTMKRPLHSYQQKELRIENSAMLPHASAHRENAEHKGRVVENNYDLIQQLKKSSPSETTPNNDAEAYDAPQDLMSPIMIETKSASCKSIDFVEEDYEEDEDDHDHDHGLDEDGTEDNSIPTNICESSDAESTTSSLSTFSDVDNNSDLSSHASGDNHHHNTNGDYKDEGVGYDTDQAHVSQIVGAMEGSTCSAAGNDEIPDDEQSTSPAPSGVYSKGQKHIAPPISPKYHHKHHDQSDPHSSHSSHSSWQKLIVFLRSLLQYPSEICYGIINFILSVIRRSSLYLTATKGHERFSRQTKKLSREFRKITNWLIDVEEVFTVLLIRLLKTSRKILGCITKALIIIVSFLFQLLKFGLIEAVEEFNGVTICYLVLYLMPSTLILLMDYINLPHWTPHIVTWLAVFYLCHQVKPGTLHETTDVSVLSLMRKLATASSISTPTTLSNGISSNPSSSQIITQQNPQQQQEEVSRPREEQICNIILKVLKSVLPVLFVVDGFSSQFGTIIGVSGANRLTTAFTMSLIRKSLLSSPIGWVSWAIQVMMATYYHSWTLLDYFILLIGLSSIRLIRYLDVQRVRGKRRREK